MKRYIVIKNIGRLVSMNDAEVIQDAVCVIKSGRVEWFGKKEDAPQIEEYMAQTIDADGGTVMPGLVDCHTHLVHGGSRQNEARMRAEGVSYEEIARDGGGILSTVNATRKATEEELLESAMKRADEALANGITTVEVKSGYGLDIETELKMLRVIEKLDSTHAISFVPTFLGAHSIPFEYKNDRKKYIDIILNEMLPKVAEEGLASFCDVFVEGIAFTKEEARQILEEGLRYGLTPKIHADQLSSCGGAELSAEIHAISADHLENISDEGIVNMKEAGVTAVLIPGSTFYLGQEEFAPARKLIDAGINVALSTDYNPGTSPTLDLFLMATIAISKMKMTMDEALRAITANAARAIDLIDGRGEIRKDGVADLIILDAPDEYFPVYRFGSSFVKTVIKKGRVVFEK